MHSAVIIWSNWKKDDTFFLSLLYYANRLAITTVNYDNRWSISIKQIREIESVFRTIYSRNIRKKTVLWGHMEGRLARGLE